MPTIYADNKDARIVSSHDQWFRARDNVGGTMTAIPGHGESSAVAVCGYSPFNKTISEFNTGDDFNIVRSFYYFDFSSVSGTVVSATLSIHGLTNGGVNCRIIKSTAFGGDGGTALATSDWTAIPGYNSGGTLSGNVTDYSTEITSWNTSGYNSFALNGAARNDINNNGRLIVCLIDTEWDYPDTDPTGQLISGLQYNGGYFSEEGGTSKDPKIDYVTVAGWNEVNGVTKSNVQKVNGVSLANISRIIGR